MKSRVVLLRCPVYDPTLVEKTVFKGLQLLGGMDRIFHTGEKILLKPNLLAADPPEKAVTTHPQVFRAAAKALQQHGVDLFYGDSPGFGSIERAARKTGIMDIANELGIELANFSKSQHLFCEQCVQNKSFQVAEGVLACDGLVSLPKLKTHGLMRMTGAIKNQFGCIPGLLKGEYHVKLPKSEEFARMLVDLNLALRPRLYIVDGIIGMEGNGPRGGNTRDIGLLAFSTDPVALDRSLCRIMGIDPRQVPTIRIGAESGLGTADAEQIEVLGDFIEAGENTRFKSALPADGFSQKAGWLRQGITPRPKIDINMCINCGVCVQSCPVRPGAVNWNNDDKDSAPIYDYKRCIRCYCCQEMCPEGAISLYIPPAARALGILRPRTK